jgi:hypothetical protein
VVWVFVAANHHEIANLEVRKLDGLAIFAVFGFVREVNCYRGAVGPGHLEGVAVNGSDLADSSVTISGATALGIAAAAGSRTLNLILGCRWRTGSLRRAGNSDG